jgi:hypothetical protein
MAHRNGETRPVSQGSKAENSTGGRWRRLARLPRPARLAGLVLLACAAAPPTALMVALARESLLTSHQGARPFLLNVTACCAALVALLVFERPRSSSPLAYARQLRARFLELQSTYDADFRRRPEGKEKEDDLEVSSEP